MVQNKDLLAQPDLELRREVSMGTPQQEERRSNNGEGGREEVENFLRSVGTVICALRKESDLSQRTLAARAQCTQAYLSDIEAGKRSVTIPMLIKVCRALNVRLSDVVIRAELEGCSLDRVQKAKLEYACAILEELATERQG